MGTPGLKILTAIIMIVASLLLFSVASVISQETAPPFTKIGCPKPATWPFEGDDKCLLDEETWPEVVGFSKNNNVYRIIRARSWWHCGMACDPTTPCKYWTYRHGQRRCYLLKSCCESQGDKAYQSGTNK